MTFSEPSASVIRCPLSYSLLLLFRHLDMKNKQTKDLISGFSSSLPNTCWNRCYKTRHRCSINQIEFQIKTKYRMFALIPSFTEQSKVTFCLYCCEVFSRLFSMNYWFTWRWVLAYLQSPDALYAAFFSFSSVEILRHLNVQEDNRKVFI